MILIIFDNGDDNNNNNNKVTCHNQKLLKHCLLHLLFVERQKNMTTIMTMSNFYNQLNKAAKEESLLS